MMRQYFRFCLLYKFRAVRCFLLGHKWAPMKWSLNQICLRCKVAKPGEVPIITQMGERIFTRKEVEKAGK